MLESSFTMIEFGRVFQDALDPIRNFRVTRHFESKSGDRNHWRRVPYAEP